MSGILRAFLAHPRQIGDDGIVRLQAEVKNVILILIEQAGGGWNAVEVVTGRDDFNLRLMDSGGWEGWCQSVGAGTTYRDGVIKPTFDLIVVSPSTIVGKGTERIVAAALNAKRPVFFYEDSTPRFLRDVVGIEVLNGNDYKAGFALICR